MEGRNDGRTDKANTKSPLAILWRGHKKRNLQYSIEQTGSHDDSSSVEKVDLMK